ncbi:MAG: hypothetical protein KW788_03100 [Candidatus Doudnabacteria bacterium]|nr:hypothetical protein [Candidatus Doudnabacteria bacterium]
MVLRVLGSQTDREDVQGETTESSQEKMQKVEDASEVKRIEGVPGMPRQRAGIEQRGPERRVKDIRKTFPKWDEGLVGRRNTEKKDRREAQRRTGLPEQRGNSPRTHRRATDVSYVRTITEREIPSEQSEGCGSVVALGSRTGEPASLPEVTRRPEGTAEARLNERPADTGKPVTAGSRRSSTKIETPAFTPLKLEGVNKRLAGDNLKPLGQRISDWWNARFKGYGSDKPKEESK